MSAPQKTIILISGPTAVGKTAVAIDIAEYFGTEIISADSRQCFKELKIGVARPSQEELQRAHHYFIASHSIHQKVTAATFEHYALEKASMIFQNHSIGVMVGGTGLYIKAFAEGMDEIPEVPELIRKEIEYEYQLRGLEWLQLQVKQLDPGFYEVGEVHNPHRLIRALEIKKATGQSILDFRKGAKTERAFRMIKLALELPKEELHQRINQRVDQMMEQGLEEEVRSLIPYQHLNALQTVGYKELFDYFNGLISLQDAIGQIKRNTRQYAKRQMTWFRKDKEFTWLKPEQVMEWVTERSC